MRRLVKFGTMIVIGSALAVPVVVADPFPNQPGALSEQEIQAAQDAMTPMLGSEPKLPLSASGRRIPGHTMPSYVVFATPPARKSGRVLVERRVICNFFGSANTWRCSMPHDALLVDANGVKHKFSLQAIEGPAMDDAEVLEIADYVYSECFAAQFKALDEAKDVTSFNTLPIHTIMKRPGPAYSVFTGMWPDEDIYSLIGSVKPADGCRYKIVSVTFGKREWEKQLAEKRRREEEAALAEQNRLAQEAAVRESFKDPEIHPTFHGLKPDELMILGLVLGVTTVYVLGPFLVVMVLVWLIWGITRIYKPGLSLEWPLAISGFALIAFVIHFLM